MVSPKVTPSSVISTNSDLLRPEVFFQGQKLLQAFKLRILLQGRQQQAPAGVAEDMVGIGLEVNSKRRGRQILKVRGRDFAAQQTGLILHRRHLRPHRRHQQKSHEAGEKIDKRYQVQLHLLRAAAANFEVYRQASSQYILIFSSKVAAFVGFQQGKGKEKVNEAGAGDSSHPGTKKPRATLICTSLNHKGFLVAGTVLA